MSTTDSGTCRWETAVGAEEEDSEGVRQTTLFHIFEIHLDLKTGKSKRRPILSNSEQVNLEAEMVNRNMLERKTQFTYLALAGPWPKVSGFAKVYLFTGELKKYMYGDKKFGGEPLFLSRSPDSKKEDDGYILVFVHIEKEWKSMFCTADIEVDEI